MKLDIKNLDTLNLDAPNFVGTSLLEEIQNVRKLPVNNADDLETKRQALGRVIESYPRYDGDDLGPVFDGDKIRFRVWGPIPQNMVLRIYKDGEPKEGEPNEPVKIVPLTRVVDNNGIWNGTWTAEVSKDEAKDLFYTYGIGHKKDDRDLSANEYSDYTWEDIVDPYAKAVGINCKRGQLIDLRETDPEGWDKFKDPILVIDNRTDAIIYELHVGSFTGGNDSGGKHKGKFLALTEEGTKNSAGYSTGIDHLAELPITHAQIMPVIAATNLDEKDEDPIRNFNWNYNPDNNLMVLDGHFSTNPYDGKVAIHEFKQAIQSLRKHGIEPILDVVYPHTARRDDSVPSKLAGPEYWYRTVFDKEHPEGRYAGGTYLDQEVATETPMVSKYIADCTENLTNEFGIVNFRFDQGRLIDQKTTDAILSKLHKIYPNIKLIYSEGWDKSDVLPAYKLSGMDRGLQLPEQGYFENVARHSRQGHYDGLFKRGNEYPNGLGLVEGNPKYALDVLLAMLGLPGRYAYPGQVIQYNSCHDNGNNYDQTKLITQNAIEQGQLPTVYASDEVIKDISKLKMDLLLLSQGVPFFPAGDEFLHSQDLKTNTYNDGPASAIDWSKKTENHEFYQAIKNRMAFRRAHPSFRIPTFEEILQNSSIHNLQDQNVIMVDIDGYANGDPIKKFRLIVNYGSEEQHVELPPNSKWDVLANREKASDMGLAEAEGFVTIPPHSSYVLADHESYKEMKQELSQHYERGDMPRRPAAIKEFPDPEAYANANTYLKGFYANAALTYNICNFTHMM